MNRNLRWALAGVLLGGCASTPYRGHPAPGHDFAALEAEAARSNEADFAADVRALGDSTRWDAHTDTVAECLNDYATRNTDFGSAVQGRKSALQDCLERCERVVQLSARYDVLERDVSLARKYQARCQAAVPEVRAHRILASSDRAMQSARDFLAKRVYDLAFDELDDAEAGAREVARVHQLPAEAEARLAEVQQFRTDNPDAWAKVKAYRQSPKTQALLSALAQREDASERIHLRLQAWRNVAEGTAAWTSYDATGARTGESEGAPELHALAQGQATEADRARLANSGELTRLQGELAAHRQAMGVSP